MDREWQNHDLLAKIVHAYVQDSMSEPYVSEHNPWVEAPDPPFAPWVSEGSVSVRDGVLHRSSRPRREAHSAFARIENVSEVPTVQEASRSSAITSSPSQREKLVFERELTIQSDGQTKRLSLQVSAKTMAPDMVDMMLELQDLNSYFGSDTNGQADVDVPRTMPAPPTLMLSTSTYNTPLSLESSSSLLSEKPLAIRRGQKLPVALELIQHKSYKNDLPYPGIPTPFLGSSSSFSPSTEGCNNAPTSGLSLDEMISDLKSRCASLRGGRKPLPPIKEEKPLPTTPTTIPTSDVVDDEWAFAGDGHTAVTTSEETFHDDEPGTVSSCTVVSCSPKSDTTLGDDVAGLLKSEFPPKPSKNYGPPTAPPGFPLPRPTSAHRKRVRGILKSTKSVRFAILPGEDQIDPRDSLDALPIIALSDRQDAKPNNRKPLTSSMKTRTKSSYRDEASNNPGDPFAGRKSERKAGSRRVSESSATGSHPMRDSTMPNRNSVAEPKGRLPVFSLGRHSLGAKTGRETRARASSLQAPQKDENDNVAKGSVRVRDSGSQKSRMPVAVQKMFMRFK